MGCDECGSDNLREEKKEEVDKKNPDYDTVEETVYICDDCGHIHT